MKRVVKMMNGELADAALAPEVLDGVFEMWWPKLEADVEQLLENKGEAEGEGRRSERDLLEEVLGLTRRLAIDRERRLDTNHPAWRDLVGGILVLARAMRGRTLDEESAKAFRNLMSPLEYILRRDMRNDTGRFHSREILMELDELFASDRNTPTSGIAPDHVRFVTQSEIFARFSDVRQPLHGMTHR